MRKRKIILIILIVLLVIVGILAFLYYKTDILKTDEQLFWKYAVKNSELTQMFNNNDITEIEKQKVNNSYKVDSNLDINTKNGVYKVVSKTNADNSNDIFTQVEFSKNSDNIMNFNLVKKSNIIGIKMDELANGYISVKNSDLKSLASKIGVENTEKFPDNINWETCLDILEISDDDMSYITDKYSKLIISNTNKSNYSKNGTAGIKINEKIHTAKGYKLTLSENESKNILANIFEELSKDSRTLNLITCKLKMLNLPSEYTQINLLSNKFLEISNNIKSMETTDDELIEIIVYEENSRLIQTNVKFGKDRLIKIVNDKENNKINIKQELLTDNFNSKFVLSISDLLNKICSQIEEINISNEINEKNIISTKIEILCKNDVNINYSSVTQITDEIDKSNDYEKSNKIVLNDLNENQLKNLYNAITNTALSIYQDKKAILFN